MQEATRLSRVRRRWLVGLACLVAGSFALLRISNSDLAGSREARANPSSLARGESRASSADSLATKTSASLRETPVRRDPPSSAENQQTASPIQSVSSEVQSEARRYYLRDRNALLRTFLAGHSSPFTGAQLAQKFQFEDWVDKDALAAVVDAQTIAAQSRLDVLGNEYMAMLDAACDTALTAGPSEVIDAADSKSIHRNEGDVHRILVESGDDVYVYRLRVADPERLEQLRRESGDLIRERERVTVETLTAITGETPKRRSTVDPFHRKKESPEIPR